MVSLGVSYSVLFIFQIKEKLVSTHNTDSMPHKLGRASGCRTLPWLTRVPTRTCPARLGRCSVLWPLLTAGPVVAAGHNSDGKFIARAQRIEYDCELVPRRVAIFIEKTKDGQILPVPNVVVRDVACGANHTVSLERFWPFFWLPGCHLSGDPWLCKARN